MVTNEDQAGAEEGPAGVQTRASPAQGLPALRRTRVLALLTMKEVAEKSGLSLSTIKRMESGQGMARLETLRKLSAALGKDPRVLLGREPDPDVVQHRISSGKWGKGR